MGAYLETERVIAVLWPHLLESLDSVLVKRMRRAVFCVRAVRAGSLAGFFVTAELARDAATLAIDARGWGTFLEGRILASAQYVGDQFLTNVRAWRHRVALCAWSELHVGRHVLHGARSLWVNRGRGRSPPDVEVDLPVPALRVEELITQQHAALLPGLRARGCPEAVDLHVPLAATLVLKLVVHSRTAAAVHAEHHFGTSAAEVAERPVPMWAHHLVVDRPNHL